MIQDLFAEQRVFTPEEYALLGYDLRDDVQFSSGSYETDVFTLPHIVPHYRADEPEELFMDIGYVTVKVASTMNPYTTLLTIVTLLY